MYVCIAKSSLVSGDALVWTGVDRYSVGILMLCMFFRIMARKTFSAGERAHVICKCLTRSSLSDTRKGTGSYLGELQRARLLLDCWLVAIQNSENGGARERNCSRCYMSLYILRFLSSSQCF